MNNLVPKIEEWLIEEESCSVNNLVPKIEEWLKKRAIG